MPLITRAQIAKVAPHAAAPIAAAIADHADDVLPRHGLATTARLTDFLAHVLVETNYLRRTDENLSYSAERLHAVWPTRFPTLASAEPYARNPKALANKVYGGRMGNVGPDDGWLNRGQGLLETTGHDNIARLARYLGKSFEDARLMLTADTHMLDCAAATYVMLGAPHYADAGDIVGTTKAVNGGTNGLADRRAMLALCRKVWPRVVTPASPPTRPTPAAAPPTPPSTQQTKAPPMTKTWFAAFLAALGLSVSAAQAGTIDLTPALTAILDNLAVPMLAATIPLVASLITVPLRHYLGQRTADLLASRINDLLEKAIAYGAKQAEAWVSHEDFHANVDNWIAEIAARYALDHAPALLQQAGGALSQKIEARIASHVDVLALKATAAAANDNPPGAPLDLTPEIAKAA